MFNDEWINTFNTASTNPSHNYGSLSLSEPDSGSLETAGMSLAPSLLEKTPRPVTPNAPAQYEWSTIEQPIESNENVSLYQYNKIVSDQAHQSIATNPQVPVSMHVAEPAISSSSTPYPQIDILSSFINQEYLFGNDSHINTTRSETAANETHLLKPSAAVAKVPTGKRSMEDCLVVFAARPELPEARPSKRHRRPLNEDSRKAFKKTRGLGACHQCKFRKAPVSKYSCAFV